MNLRTHPKMAGDLSAWNANTTVWDLLEGGRPRRRRRRRSRPDHSHLGPRVEDMEPSPFNPNAPDDGTCPF